MAEKKKVENPKIEPLAFRINDACEALQISRSSLYSLVAEGKLRLIKIAGRSLIPRSEIDRLLSGEAA